MMRVRWGRLDRLPFAPAGNVLLRKTTTPVGLGFFPITWVGRSIMAHTESEYLMKICTLSIGLVAGVAWLAGCEASHSYHAGGHRVMWSAVSRAICVVHPTTGNRCNGLVAFQQEGDQVRVEADISGLSPNSEHAIHIHTYGDASSGDGKSAGGHYNPENHAHGLPVQRHRHAGDLGNLKTDATGRARYTVMVDNISVAGLKNPIIGRSIIVHAKRDTGGQPTGEAGARIGCGVIGIAKVDG